LSWLYLINAFYWGVAEDGTALVGSFVGANDCASFGHLPSTFLQARLSRLTAVPTTQRLMVRRH
jgi:hypothetical protein